MAHPQALFEQARNAFNSIQISKGQVVTIATCDADGVPDLAPIGSMRVVDEHTVHVLQGFLPRTLRNLKINPKAAFSVTLPPTTLGSFKTILGKDANAPLGYRMYCELTSIEEEQALVQSEARELTRRAPLLLRGAFLRFCERNLKRLLRFRIVEVRPT
jgi:hypothetical protein